MQWRKVPPELAAFMERKTASLACERRKMFGCPAFFVNENMFAGVHQKSIILRLSQADREEFFRAFDDAAHFEPMPGRPMREYVVVPPALSADDEAFHGWLRRSFEHVASLPPKAKKSARGKRKG